MRRLTVPRAAALFGVTQRTVYRWMHIGLVLREKRGGNRFVVLPDDFVLPPAQGRRRELWDLRPGEQPGEQRA